MDEKTPEVNRQMNKSKELPFQRLMTPALVLIAYICVGFRPVDAPRIAIVDMSKLVSQHKQTQAEQALVAQWREANLQKMSLEDKDLKADRGSLDQFKPGSDDFKKKQQEIKLKEFTFNQEAKALDEEFDNKVAKSLVDAHARAAAACKRYLDSHDLDVVLQYETGPVRGDTRNEVVPDIVVRTVVAYRGALDVTDAVLAILDTP